MNYFSLMSVCFAYKQNASLDRRATSSKSLHDNLLTFLHGKCIIFWSENIGSPFMGIRNGNIISIKIISHFCFLTLQRREAKAITCDRFDKCLAYVLLSQETVRLSRSSHFSFQGRLQSTADDGHRLMVDHPADHCVMEFTKLDK